MHKPSTRSYPMSARITCAMRLVTSLALIALSFTVGAPARAQTTDRPNILFILLDNLGWGEFGIYGGGILRGAPTPNVDAFANQALRLTNFNVEASCMPSRSAMLTGRYSVRSGTLKSTSHGLVDWEVTIADLLHEQGYSTGAFGKWHLGEESSQLPVGRGFDEWYGIPTSSHTALFRQSPGFDPSVQPPEYMLEQSRTTPTRKVKEYTLDERREIDGELTARTIDFMQRNAAARTPFFAYVALTQVHFPTVPSKEFAGRTGYGDFADSVVQTDAYIGRILDALASQGLEKNTIVVVTSDNGPEYRRPWRGSAGVWSGAYHTMLEGGLRAPFLIRWPDHIRPRASDAVVHATDLFSTFAGAAGTKIPTDRPIDGVDQMPFMTGQTAGSARDGFPIFIEGELYGAKWRDWKYHLIWLKEPTDKPEHLDQPKLFNVTLDPKEESPRHGIEDMWVRKQIQQLIATTKASFKAHPPIPDGAPTSYVPK